MPFNKLKFLKYLVLREGWHNHVYLDSASPRNHTVGVGFNMDYKGALDPAKAALMRSTLNFTEQQVEDVRNGKLDLTDQQTFDLLVATATSALNTSALSKCIALFASFWDNIGEDRQIVLADMMFNMGALTGNGKFNNMVTAIKSPNPDWTEAARQAQYADPPANPNLPGGAESTFYQKGGNRAKDDVYVLQNGYFPVAPNSDAIYYVNDWPVLQDVPSKGDTSETSWNNIFNPVEVINNDWEEGGTGTGTTYIPQTTNLGTFLYAPDEWGSSTFYYPQSSSPNNTTPDTLGTLDISTGWGPDITGNNPSGTGTSGTNVILGDVYWMWFNRLGWLTNGVFGPSRTLPAPDTVSKYRCHLKSENIQ